jgi:hypothetical protein
MDEDVAVQLLSAKGLFNGSGKVGIWQQQHSAATVGIRV